MFHVNEIYLTHVISIVEQKIGSETMKGKALLLNNISAIQKSMIGDLALANELRTRVTNSAEAVKTCSLLQFVGVCFVLSDPTSRLRQFFTIKSKKRVVSPFHMSILHLGNPYTTTIESLNEESEN